MKKLSYFLTAACAVWALTSCEQDREPVYHAPTPGSFEVYTPAMQDQYIVLAPGNYTIELVCNGQPDYGYSAVANYMAQVSLTEDFAEFYEIKPVDNHQSRMQIRQNSVSIAFCVLSGLEDENDFNAMFPNGVPFQKLYFRASCSLNNVEGSEITSSNVVSYNYIQPYYAIAVPAYIYLVGTPSGWAEPNEGNAATYEDWKLYEPEDGIGENVFYGTFDIEANPTFRFYTALTGWDADSYGYQEKDEGTSFPAFTGEEEFEEKLIKGKGAYMLPNWPGGSMDIKVDMSDESNMKVVFSAAE